MPLQSRSQCARGNLGPLPLAQFRSLKEIASRAASTQFKWVIGGHENVVRTNHLFSPAQVAVTEETARRDVDMLPNVLGDFPRQLARKSKKIDPIHIKEDDLTPMSGDDLQIGKAIKHAGEHHPKELDAGLGSASQYLHAQKVNRHPRRNRCNKHPARHSAAFAGAYRGEL